MERIPVTSEQADLALRLYAATLNRIDETDRGCYSRNATSSPGTRP